MRNLVVMMMIFLLPYSVMAQETSSNKKPAEPNLFFLEGSFGVSTPVGSYLNAEPENKKSGFAKTGYLFQVTLDWMGKKDIGMAIQYSNQNNPIQSSLKYDTLPGRTYPMGSGSWSNHYFLIGPVYYKEIKKFVIDVKILGGVVLAFSPLFNYTSPDSLHRTVKGYGSGFAYEFAVDGGYSVSSRLQVKVGICFLGAFPTFHKQYGGEYMGTDTYVDPVTHAVEYVNVYAPAVLIDLKNYITTFNASVGVIIKL